MRSIATAAILFLSAAPLFAQPAPMENAREEFEKRLARARTAETKYDLAMWAWDQELKKEYRETLEAAIRQDPDHRASRRALGHFRHGEEWLTPEEAKEKGLVECREEWVTPETAKKEEEVSRKKIAGLPEGTEGKGGGPGDHVGSVEIRGKKREYRLFVPKSYDPAKPTPLLLWLHGDGGTKDSYARIFRPLIEKENFIAVCPESRRWQVWAEGAEGGTYTTAKTEDDEYVLLCVETVKRKYNIDPRRVYCGGQSKGATYTTKLVRQMGEYFAGGMLVNGVITSSYPKPSYHKSAFAVWFGSKDYLHPRYGIRTHCLEQTGHPVKLFYKEGAGHGATPESLEVPWKYISGFRLGD